MKGRRGGTRRDEMGRSGRPGLVSIAEYRLKTLEITSRDTRADTRATLLSR
jgi:hypothetical protein